MVEAEQQRVTGLGLPACQLSQSPRLEQLRRHRGRLLRCLEQADEHARALSLHHPSHLGQSSQRIGRLVLALIAIVGLPTAPSAKEQILCKHAEKPDVVITLGARRQFGRTLNCISGNFIVDLTPCAPDGSYGLSAGTGSAPLVAIVDLWQDYMTHLGGVTSNFTNDHKIYFSGGFNSPLSNTTINQNRASNGLPPIPDENKIPEGQGYGELWSFTLSRLTGNAVLRVKDKVDFTYDCKKTKAIL